MTTTRVKSDPLTVGPAPSDLGATKPMESVECVGPRMLPKRNALRFCTFVSESPMRSTVVNHGIIVVLDALGARHFHIQRCREYISARDDAMRIALEDYRLKNCGEDGVGPAVSLKPVASLTFGDSILFAWNFDTDKRRIPVALSFVASWVASFLVSMMARGFLYRGAMSTGAYVLANRTNTVIGPAVADAAAWYEMGDWFGVVATPSCERVIEYFREVKESASKSESGNQLYLDHLNSVGIRSDTVDYMSILEERFSQELVQYRVPFKPQEHTPDNRPTQLWVVNWPKTLFREKTNRSADARIAFYSALRNLEGPLPNDAVRKLANSIQFFDSCVSRTACGN